VAADLLEKTYSKMSQKCAQKRKPGTEPGGFFPSENAQKKTLNAYHQPAPSPPPRWIEELNLGSPKSSMAAPKGPPPKKKTGGGGEKTSASPTTKVAFYDALRWQRQRPVEAMGDASSN